MPSDMFHLKTAEHLQCKHLKALNFKECGTLFAGANHCNGSKASEIAARLEDDNICTGNSGHDDVWIGDVGNAIVSEDYKLIGVASWISGWCDGLPNVYTKIYPHLEWIENEMRTF